MSLNSLGGAAYRRRRPGLWIPCSPGPWASWLARCSGTRHRECFCGVGGEWVEHVVSASESELEEASRRIDADPALEVLFEGIDTHSVLNAAARGSSFPRRRPG